MDKIKEQILKGTVSDIHLSEPITYVDNSIRERSGHVGHALILTKSGKLLDFNANTSAYRLNGHAAFGWMEYRISEDGGETFGESKIFPYSKEVFLKGLHTISVEKGVCCDDGTVVTFCLVNSQRDEICCEPWDIPLVIRSFDEGETWQQPEPLCEFKGRIYDVLYKDGEIYVLMFCNDAEVFFCGNKPEHLYRLYKSSDNGKTFREESVVGFEDTADLGYGALVYTPDNRLIAYAYHEKDEQNMRYAISDDGGKTWSETGISHVAQRIRNPQIAFFDGQYILHGRSCGDTSIRGFVIYTSADGLHWDNGHVLNDTNYVCYYSNNIQIGNRLLVQYSESYYIRDGREWHGEVNIMHLWLENVTKEPKKGM